MRAADGALEFDVELTPTPFSPGSRLDLLARRLLRAAADAAGALGRREAPN